jgi:hypothetical protein
MVIQSLSQLYRHSHGLYNNLKALVNPYPKWKEKNAFRDLEDALRVPEGGGTLLILLRSHKVLSKFVRFAWILFGLNYFVSSSILPGFGQICSMGTREKSKQCKQT